MLKPTRKTTGVDPVPLTRLEEQKPKQMKSRLTTLQLFNKPSSLNYYQSQASIVEQNEKQCSSIQKMSSMDDFKEMRQIEREFGPILLQSTRQPKDPKQAKAPLEQNDSMWQYISENIIESPQKSKKDFDSFLLKVQNAAQQNYSKEEEQRKQQLQAFFEQKKLEKQKNEMKKMFTLDEENKGHTAKRSLKSQQEYMLMIKQQLDRINQSFQEEEDFYDRGRKILKLSQHRTRRAPTRVESSWSKRRWDLFTADRHRHTSISYKSRKHLSVSEHSQDQRVLKVRKNLNPQQVASTIDELPSDSVIKKRINNQLLESKSLFQMIIGACHTPNSDDGQNSPKMKGKLDKNLLIRENPKKYIGPKFFSRQSMYKTIECERPQHKLQIQLQYQVLTNLKRMLELVEGKIQFVDMTKKKKGLDLLLQDKAFLRTQIQFCQAYRHKQLDLVGIRVVENNLSLIERNTPHLCKLIVALQCGRTIGDDLVETAKGFLNKPFESTNHNQLNMTFKREYGTKTAMSTHLDGADLFEKQIKKPRYRESCDESNALIQLYTPNNLSRPKSQAGKSRSKKGIYV